jgi:hypothetical protein
VKVLILGPGVIGSVLRTFRSPMGEACLAAHARHAEGEMRSLMRSVGMVCGIPGPSVGNLERLMAAPTR